MAEQEEIREGIDGYPETLEGCIHKAFHDIADKYGLDVDVVAEIIKDYDNFMSFHLERKIVIEEN